MSLNLDELAWSVAEGETEEYVFEIRIRHFGDNLTPEQYPQRLNIFWEMGETFENGLPTESELEKVHDFENRLVQAVEEDEFGILAMVLTGGGQREFAFYTADPQEFIQRLTNMPQEEEPYPIEIHCNEDAEWDYYFSELNSIVDA